jgi:hypothetical protein
VNSSSLPSPADSPTNPTTQGQPVFGSELERRAAEARLARARERGQRDRLIAQQNAEAATFAIALAQPCPEHKAAPGKPCWRLSPDDLHHRAAKGVCGPRITQAVGVARLRREREAREQAKAAKMAKTTRVRRSTR